MGYYPNHKIERRVFKKVGRFQILCVTMNQVDFSKIHEMNVHSDIIFSNQTNKNCYDELMFDNHIAKMISTNTKGVGINRNIGLMYADSEICIFADDDVFYYDDLEKIVLSEFDSHPDAEVIIFHLDTDTEERKLEQYKKTRRVHIYDRKPWGAVRIAFRLDAVKKANVFFSTLFGGGSKYPCGEDSIWIEDTIKKGLVYYVSNRTIGMVSCKESTWFTGFDEKRYFAAGALYEFLHPKTIIVWKFYFVFRTLKYGKLSFQQKKKWFENGIDAYRRGRIFENYS